MKLIRRKPVPLAVSPYAWLLPAACVNILWLLLYRVAADLNTHMIWTDCFVTQFWQGNLYPRWCFDANEGLGAPLFVFYFPLPYYIAALFYPLTYLGLSQYGLFVFLCFLASLLTAFTCYSWLKEVVAPRYAILATWLFLFMPYRMEVMYFRVGYAELWGMVFLPLVFKYIRRMTLGDIGSILPLAVSVGLSFLAHGPDTIIALIFGGVYVLIMTGRAYLPKVHYAIGVIWGVAIAAFYLVPAWYYQRFMAVSAEPEKLVEGLSGWANGYMMASMLSTLLVRPIEAFVLTVLCLAGVSYVLLTRSTKIGNAFVRREIIAWGLLAVMVLCLLFPVSAPLYMLMGPFSKFIFPWRMQVIVMMGFTYMLAVWMHWLSSERSRSLWKIVYGIGIFVLLVISFALVDDDQSLVPNAAKSRASKVINVHEYRSIWTDEYHWSSLYIFLRHDRREIIPKIEMVSGEGDVAVKRWAWDGIELNTRSTGALKLRLDHNYYPIWQAVMDGQVLLALKPEPKSGQILMDVPPGEHTVAVTASLLHGEPKLLISQWVSMLAALMAFSAVLRLKYFDKSGAA